MNTRFFHAGRLTVGPAFLRTCSAFSTAITTSSWLRTPSIPWSPDSPPAVGRAVLDGVCAGSAAPPLVERSVPWAGPPEGTGASPSACRAFGGIASPSANASKVAEAVGVLLCRAHSLSRPWPIPISSEICPCVTRACQGPRRSSRDPAERTRQEHPAARRLAPRSRALQRYPCPRRDPRFPAVRQLTMAQARYDSNLNQKKSRSWILAHHQYNYFRCMK